MLLRFVARAAGISKRQGTEEAADRGRAAWTGESVRDVDQNPAGLLPASPAFRRLIH